MIHTGAELIEKCLLEEKDISQVMLEQEIEESGLSKEEILTKLDQVLVVMFESIERGLKNEERSLGGLIGGEAKKMLEAIEMNNLNYLPKNSMKAIAYSMAVMEVNSLMGIICAAPTAGSCGVLPAVLKYAQDLFEFDKATLRKGLLTASATGFLVTKNATVSGAEGGCQAEIGTATAMAAAALVAMRNGTPNQCLDAASFSFKNIMGLVCDPIAGLVESPCTKRNALGTMNALMSADMALLGIASILPFDEVVEAMYRVGRMMSPDLKETARGGLAACPTAKAIEKRIFG
jgi:L-serine dehydratase